MDVEKKLDINDQINKSYDRQIEKIIKMNISKQNQLFRIFAKADLLTKLEILKKQKKIFYKLKTRQNNIDNIILAYSSMVLAILSIKQNINREEYNAKIFKATKFRKSLKRDKILEKWAIIRSLRNDEKLSFRQISAYLRKYHRFNVSYSLIYEIWTQLAEKNINEGE